MVPRCWNKKKVPIILSQGANPIFERSQSVGSPVTFGHSHFMNRIFFLGITGLLISSGWSRAADSNRWEVIRDVEYARIGGLALQLDLHIPGMNPRSPLIVWVHGGAWRS